MGLSLSRSLQEHPGVCGHVGDDLPVSPFIVCKTSLSKERLAEMVSPSLQNICLELSVENWCASQVATAATLRLDEANLEQETWLKLSG